MSQAATDQPYVPIIIVNWNGIEDTRKCLDSVLRTNYANYHIFLVDNGSDDGEGELLKRSLQAVDRIEVITLEKNIGFAKANCHVFENYVGPNVKYLALLNNDTEVHPDWLGEMVSCAQKFHAHVISGKIINYFDRTLMDNAGHQMLNTGEIIPIGHGKNAALYHHSFENMGSCAAGTLYRVDMLRDLGFFDPFFSTGYEDAELGVRAVVAGYRCVFAPQSVIYHKMGSSIQRVFDIEYAVMIQEAIWYSYFKLMPPLVICLCLPLILLKQILLLILNIVFWKPIQLQVQTAGWRATVKNYRKIIDARNHFFHNRYTMGSGYILRRQVFFLRYDLKRFVHVYLKRRKSALEQYGA